MRSPQQYTDLVHEALLVAQGGDRFWNERFRSALQRRGLMLATGEASTGQPEAYPDGAPLQAPRPVEGPAGWPEESLVVWQGDVAWRVLTRPLFRLREGATYIPGPDELVIREEHSIDDVLRHLIDECGGDKAELLAILETLPAAAEGGQGAA